MILFHHNDETKMNNVEVIGPDYSLPLTSNGMKILTYKEVMNHHNPKIKNRDLNENDDKVVPLDIHHAVIDQIKNDANTYATSKSNSQNLLNISVVQSQILLLVNVLQLNRINAWGAVLITLIANALILEFIIFVLLVLLAKSKTEQVTKYCMATGMNSLVTTLSGLLLIITSGITIVSKVVIVPNNLSGNGNFTN